MTRASEELATYELESIEEWTPTGLHVVAEDARGTVGIISMSDIVRRRLD